MPAEPGRRSACTEADVLEAHSPRIRERRGVRGGLRFGLHVHDLDDRAPEATAFWWCSASRRRAHRVDHWKSSSELHQLPDLQGAVHHQPAADRKTAAAPTAVRKSSRGE